MSKKSFDRKSAKKHIIENRELGKSDNEQYQDMSEQYFDKDSIALLISTTVKEDNKEKVKVYNNLLLGLIAIYFLYQLYTMLNFTFTDENIWLLFVCVWMPVVFIYFLYEVYRYNAVIYKNIGFITILSCAQSVSKTGHIINVLFNVALCISIIILTSYLRNQLIPNINTKKMMKDIKGDYILH